MSPLLSINNLKVYYPLRDGFFKRNVNNIPAVDGVTFAIQQGETYGLVGESGCGKTTLGRAIIGLNKNTSGDIFFEGRRLTTLIGKAKRRQIRNVQMIFQNPYSSLNSRKNVLDIVAEPLRNFERLSPGEEKWRVQSLLERVGLDPESIYQYPHQFSGGQCQRISIARALTLKPKLIIADEPVSALDVSVQAQVLNFMQDIQREYNLSYLFISHDIGVVQHICDRIGVMYQGRLVEEGSVHDIYQHPQHLYTKRLMTAIPEMNPRKRQEKTLSRKAIEEAYEKSYTKFVDAKGRIWDLKKISATHSVALP